MSFDIPREAILPIDRIEVRLDPAPHPFELANAVAVEENWAREKADKPALFDGRIALLAELGLRDGVLAGRCHIVRYATFLYWRRERPGTAGHFFAHAVPVSCDGALVAVRMGGHTVNAGRVYFAAGSFEPEDFRADGQVDAEANMAREMGEETGLSLGEARAETGWYLYSNSRGTVIVRRYFFDRTADEMAEAIASHVAAEAEPEIDGAVVIRSPLDLPSGLMPHMPPLIAWHFSGAQ